jgi:uncharacterized membrane protein
MSVKPFEHKKTALIKDGEKMKSFFNRYIENAKTSLWAIPLFMTLIGLLTTWGISQLDWFLNEKSYTFTKSWPEDLEGIKTLFSSIGGTIITSMTTILSITLLIFTVLAGQYGAHVLRVFKIQVFSKIVIGWFAGTYVYIIYNIYALTIGNEDYVPFLSLTIGVVLTVTTIFLIIFYIHFLVRQIQAETVVSEIAKELASLIKELPEKNSEENPKSLQETPKLPTSNIETEVSGYIQNIDKESLQEIAENQGFVIQSLRRAGQFIFKGSPIAMIYSDSFIEEKVIEDIKSCYFSGEKRIPKEDLECNLDMLVEMIQRALSPGVNDLWVANNCIDYLGASIALLLKRQFPPTRHYSSEGELCLITKEFSFDDLLDAAFHPIRQYAVDHCNITIRIMDVLIELVQLTDSKKDRESLTKHFYAFQIPAEEKHTYEIDRLSLEEREKRFKALLSNK